MPSAKYMIVNKRKIKDGDGHPLQVCDVYEVCLYHGTQQRPVAGFQGIDTETATQFVDQMNSQIDNEGGW